ncbi:MAG: FecR family protein [Draconibacterium sp.]
MDNDIIIKYLQGTADKAETEIFFRWLDESEANRTQFKELKKIWALTAKEENNAEISWRDLQAKLNKPVKKRILYVFVKKAAVFILLVCFGAAVQYLFFGSKHDSVYTKSYSITAPAGQKTNIELPDGTLVMLNSGTKIQYSGDFTKGNRQVYLEGEAFFDVQKDVEHPFIVNSELLGVKVFGTSFNIRAYPEDREFVATLIEGSIGILNTHGEEVAQLVPGEKAYFSESETTINIRQVDTEMYTSWKEGLVTFRNEKLKDIAKQIERWYNVEIVIQKEGLGDERYFGTILKNKPIDQILEVLKLTTSLQYEIVTRADKPTLIYWK